jgi:hypothetical protein
VLLNTPAAAADRWTKWNDEAREFRWVGLSEALKCRLMCRHGILEAVAADVRRQTVCRPRSASFRRRLPGALRQKKKKTKHV